MNSKPEREISKNVLEFDVNTEYKTDLITGMNFRKYPLRRYILVSGAPGTPRVTPKTYGTTFISDIL